MRPTVTQYARVLLDLERSSGRTPEDLARLMLTLLRRRGDGAKAAAVTEAYRRLADAAQGRIGLRVTTAQPLHDEGRAAVAAVADRFFPGLTPYYSFVTDPSVLGGVIVASDDVAVDLSVRRRLQQLTERLQSTV